ncbi:hypothetical protein BC940DRAFT_304239, partial [Gongronella butleri]
MPCSRAQLPITCFCLIHYLCNRVTARRGNPTDQCDATPFRRIITLFVHFFISTRFSGSIAYQMVEKEHRRQGHRDSFL